MRIWCPKGFKDEFFFRKKKDLEYKATNQILSKMLEMVIVISSMSHLEIFIQCKERQMLPFCSMYVCSTYKTCRINSFQKSAERKTKTNSKSFQEADWPGGNLFYRTKRKHFSECTGIL